MGTPRHSSDLLAASFGFSQPFRARFEILEEVARGGMGVVLKARDRVENRALAIKLLFTGAGVQTARFEREAAALQAFRHPNIVRLYGAGTDGRRPYLLMELIEGSPLRPEDFRRSDGSIDFDSMVRIFAVIADALASCHAAGFAHRDLKPDNILVEAATRRPVLVDFGLVKVHEQQRQLPGASVALTSTGELVGTPAFMAPEQFCPSEFGAVGPAVDVWGLAACLFFLLTGRAVYPGENWIAIVAALMRSEPPRLRELEATTPPWLDDLMGSCLQRDPSLRPNIRALADGLERRGQAHALGRAVASSLQARRSGRRRWILAMVAILTLLALGFCGLVWEGRRREAALVEGAMRRATSAVAELEQHLSEGGGFAGTSQTLEEQLAAARASLAGLVDTRSSDLRLRLTLARAVLAARAGQSFQGAGGSARGRAAARLLSWSEVLRPRPPSPEALRPLEKALGEAREADAYFVLDLALVKLRMQVALGQARSAARGAQRDRLFERLPPRVATGLWKEASEAEVLTFLRRLRGDRSAAARTLARLAWRALARIGGLAAASERDRQELFESLESSGPWPEAAEEDLALLRDLLELTEDGEAEASAALADAADRRPSSAEARPGDRAASSLAALLESRPELGPTQAFEASLRALLAVIDRRGKVVSSLLVLNLARGERFLEPTEQEMLDRFLALSASAAAAAEAGGRRFLVRRLQESRASLLLTAGSALRGRADRRLWALLARFADLGLALPLEELELGPADLRQQFWEMKADGLRSELFGEVSPARLTEIRRELRSAIEAVADPSKRVKLMATVLRSTAPTPHSQLAREALPPLRPQDRGAAPRDLAPIFLMQGRELMRRERWREALRLIDEALSLDPELHEEWQPHGYKAVALTRLGELEAASATLEAAARVKAFARLYDWGLLIGAAQELFERGGPKSAMARLEQALRTRREGVSDARDRGRADTTLALCRALIRFQAGDRAGCLEALFVMRAQVSGASGVPPKIARRLEANVARFIARVKGGATQLSGEARAVFLIGPPRRAPRDGG